MTEKLKSYVVMCEETFGYELQSNASGKVIGMAYTIENAIDLMLNFEDNGMPCTIYKISRVSLTPKKGEHSRSSDSKERTINMTYQDIISMIKSKGETPENLWLLGRWFEQYGYNFWNGEYFYTEKTFNGRNLYPIYEYHAEYCSSCIVGYELR